MRRSPDPPQPFRRSRSRSASGSLVTHRGEVHSPGAYRGVVRRGDRAPGVEPPARIAAGSATRSRNSRAEPAPSPAPPASRAFRCRTARHRALPDRSAGPGATARRPADRGAGTRAAVGPGELRFAAPACPRAGRVPELSPHVRLGSPRRPQASRPGSLRSRRPAAAQLGGPMPCPHLSAVFAPPGIRAPTHQRQRILRLRPATDPSGIRQGSELCGVNRRVTSSNGRNCSTMTPPARLAVPRSGRSSRSVTLTSAAPKPAWTVAVTRRPSDS